MKERNEEIDMTPHEKRWPPAASAFLAMATMLAIYIALFIWWLLS